ncbi:MAG: hypothetical protein LIP08_10590 [Bacteroides sp.]|nr:hypothetical protein [Bacteroides sp.]
MNIYYAKTAQDYIVELSEILYEKQYFIYKESSQEYVRFLIRDMEATIHLKRKRKASFYFSRYGKDLWYVSYPRSKQTTWYFFFTHHAGDVYVIRYMTNNHVEGQYLR